MFSKRSLRNMGKSRLNIEFCLVYADFSEHKELWNFHRTKYKNCLENHLGE
jgi:hypothetical protein